MTSSCSNLISVLVAVGLCFEFFELSFKCRDLAVLEFGHTGQVAPALGLFHFVASQFDGFAQFLNIADDVLLAVPLRLERVAGGLLIAQLLLQRCQAFADAGSFSFRNASRSISSCMIRRSNPSSSSGMLSSSVRSLAAASSTRSMALSGRNRSEM